MLVWPLKICTKIDVFAPVFKPFKSDFWSRFPIIFYIYMASAAKATRTLSVHYADYSHLNVSTNALAVTELTRGEIALHVGRICRLTGTLWRKKYECGNVGSIGNQKGKAAKK